MEKKYSRRAILGLGAATGSIVLGSCATTRTHLSQKEPVSEMIFPWKYTILDVEKTKNRAYKKYFVGGCMYGVFEAIAGQAAESLGKPYTDFPFAISSYGGGGVAMWGTLCGTCNGAAMAIGLFQQGKIRNQLINQAFTFYEETSLPLYSPENPQKVKKGFQMKTSQASSTICHISITRWTETSNFQSFSPERVERCARLVADMAGKTAELLNENQKGQFTAKHQISAVANDCLECHAQGNQAPNEPEVVSRMKCTTCHEDAHKD